MAPALLLFSPEACGLPAALAPGAFAVVSVTVLYEHGFNFQQNRTTHVKYKKKEKIIFLATESLKSNC